MSYRINSFNVSRFDESDGVMTVKAVARHIGCLKYKTDSGERVEFVPPELIRGFDSEGKPHIAQLAGAIATNEHPVSLISYDDSLRQQVEVGRVKPKVKVYKDDRAEVEIEVYDSKTQDDIRAGRKRGLSVGYQVSVVKQDGEWNGVKYGYVQQAPWRVDHVAIVAHPRAPEALITRYDSDDADIAWHVDDSLTKEDAMPRQIAIGDEVFSISDDNLAQQVLMLLAENRGLKNQVEQLADELSEDDEESMDSEDAESKQDAGCSKEKPMKTKKPMMDEEEVMDSSDDSRTDGGYKSKTKKPMMEDEEEMMDSSDREDSGSLDYQTLLKEYSRLDAENAQLRAERDVADRLLRQYQADADDREDSEETHNDALETAVQNRLDELFATYEDAKDYLPNDFKLDGSMKSTDIMRKAVANFDSEIELHSDSAIEGAYSFMKRHWNRDGVRMLQDSVDRAVNTPVRTDAAAIRQTRMDEDYQRGRKPLKQAR